MKNNIRLAEKNDAKNIALVKINWWKNAYKNIIPNSFLESQNLEKLTKNFENWIIEWKLKIYLIEENDEILWFIWIKIENNICDLRLLYLNPGEIWKWYWSKLLNFLEENEKFEKIKLFVLEWNKLWINFYKKKWFVFTWNKEIFEIDWKDFTEFEMEKTYN
jgi:GNAT superfamily N-acetyltransferase